jgi:hypothetical protein
MDYLFQRPAFMNLPSNDQGQQILKDYYQLSDLIQKRTILMTIGI